MGVLKQLTTGARRKTSPNVTKLLDPATLRSSLRRFPATPAPHLRRRALHPLRVHAAASSATASSATARSGLLRHRLLRLASSASAPRLHRARRLPPPPRPAAPLHRPALHAHPSIAASAIAHTSPAGHARGRGNFLVFFFAY